MFDRQVTSQVSTTCQSSSHQWRAQCVIYNINFPLHLLTDLEEADSQVENNTIHITFV